MDVNGATVNPGFTNALRRNNLLLAHGADMHAAIETGKLKLWDLVLMCENKLAQFLWDSGIDVNSVDRTEKTVLHHCSKRGDNADKICSLLKIGADVNAADNDGRTALHFAALSVHNVEGVKYLINHVANVNAVDQNGKSPLHSVFDAYDRCDCFECKNGDSRSHDRYYIAYALCSHGARFDPDSLSVDGKIINALSDSAAGWERDKDEDEDDKDENDDDEEESISIRQYVEQWIEEFSEGRGEFENAEDDVKESYSMRDYGSKSSQNGSGFKLSDDILPSDQ